MCWCAGSTHDLHRPCVIHIWYNSLCIIWVFQPSCLNSFSCEFFQQYFEISHSVKMKTILALTFLACLQLVLTSPEPRRRYSSSSYSSSQWNQNKHFGNYYTTTARPWYHTTTRSPYKRCQCADNLSWIGHGGIVNGNCER